MSFTPEVSYTVAMILKKWSGLARFGTGRFLFGIIILSSLFFARPTIGQEGAPIYHMGSAPILLTGEWMRYSGYVDESALESSPAPEKVYVPLRDNLLSPPASTAGAASYRFQIRLVGSVRDRQYALCIPGLKDFRAVSINGSTIYDAVAGVGTSPMVYFTSSADLLSIIVQSYPGGPRLESPGPLPTAPYFGEAAAVDTRKGLVTGWVFVLITFFALGGLFMLLLFSFWRKNSEFLGFALFLFSSAIFYLLKFSGVFQSLPWLYGLRTVETAYEISLALLLSCVALLFYSLFRAELRKPLGRVFVLLPLLIVPAALFLPEAFLAVYRSGVAYAALFGLAVVALLVVELLRGNHRARWLLPAALPWAASIVCAALFRDSFLSAFFLEPVGHMAFAFVAWLMLVKKVGDSFESVETLSDYVSTVSTTVRKFIPKEFLEALDKTDVIDLKLGDHVRREMTIFFSDIRAFTELSEKLTVEENFAFINSYLSRVVPIVKENGGFIDKYIGDAIMALFPGPMGPDEAIRSAIAMQGKIVEYNGHRAKMGYRPISMGVGIHSGDLMLGVVGVYDRMESTVISDAVNLASRLQAITKAFNISLAISEQAFKELDDPGSYKYRFIGKVRVKGKAAPVSVFEIFDGLAPDLFERKMKANMFFEQGMLSYYQKDFAGAMYYFKRVLDVIPEDGAASFYLDNCMNKATL